MSSTSKHQEGLDLVLPSFTRKRRNPETRAECCIQLVSVRPCETTRNPGEPQLDHPLQNIVKQTRAVGRLGENGENGEVAYVD
jgi:hypothetical protein